MNLPFVLDIAIGLIFIYLILSLLASEIQEIIATLLQWRAVHLKKSIEVLLTGGEGTAEEKKVRKFADELYSNPLIKNINQEAKGWFETTVRSVTWGVSSVYRQAKALVGASDRNIFGGTKHSGPSYINAETFTTTLLESSGIPILIQKLSELKLEEFVRTNVEAAIAEAQLLLNSAPPSELSSANPAVDLTTAGVETVEMSPIAEMSDSEALSSDQRDQLQQAVNNFQFQLDSIVHEFKSQRASLETSLKWIAYRLDRFIENCSRICPDGNTKTEFLRRLQEIRQEIFETSEDGRSLNVQPILLSTLKPSLVEIVEAVNDKSSATYQKLLTVVEQKVGSLIPAKFQEELLREIQVVLSKFSVITQGTELETQFDQLRQQLHSLVTAETTPSAETRWAMTNQMLSERDRYIDQAESFLSDVDFLSDLYALKQIPLPAFQHELSHEIELVLDGFRDMTRNTQLYIRLDQLRQRLDEIISQFVSGQIPLLIAINQMLAERNAYIDNAEQYVDRAQIPEKRRKSFLREIRYLKRPKDYFTSLDNRVAMLAWLGAPPEVLADEIKYHSEIYRQVLEIVDSQEVSDYTKAVEAIDNLPKPVKESLSVLARRAQEKVTSIDQEVRQFQHEIENWFDRSMERASGVYKRNAKGAAILIGSLIAIAVNADTFHIVNRLSKDTLLRNSIAQSAAQISDSAQGDITVVQKQVNTALDQLPLPIGWDKANRDQQWAANQRWPIPFLKTFFGWLISGIAISMGSSFWFDLLGKVVNVRNSGKPPAKQDQPAK